MAFIARRAKRLRSIWPLILCIVLLVVLDKSVGLNGEWWITLTATLIGVFLAFWLNYLFSHLNDQEMRSQKLHRLLILLKNECEDNSENFRWLKQSITSAIDLDVLNDPACTKGIVEICNTIEDKTFYALQSAGWLDVLENGILFLNIASVYKAANQIKSLIRFTAAGHERIYEAPREQNQLKTQYETLAQGCDVIRDRLGEIISSLDERLKVFPDPIRDIRIG